MTMIGYVFSYADRLVAIVAGSDSAAMRIARSTFQLTRPDLDPRHITCVAKVTEAACIMERQLGGEGR